MKNLVPQLDLTPSEADLAALRPALQLLQSGGVALIPTDTLFGLAADVQSDGALAEVFALKGRPSELALPVLVGSWEQVGQVAQVGHPAIQELAARFWPGSLTLILPKLDTLSPLVTAGRNTVAVRMPEHWVPLALAKELGRPISGTSANRSGEPNSLVLAEVEASLGIAPGAVVRLGPPPAGVQSTIVDISGLDKTDAAATPFVPSLVREGATPFADVLECLGGSVRTSNRRGGRGGTELGWTLSWKPTGSPLRASCGSVFPAAKATCTPCSSTTWGGWTSKASPKPRPGAPGFPHC